MRENLIERTSVGAVEIPTLICDHCGRRWAASDASRSHFWLQREGLVTDADRLEWNFCSLLCVSRFFRPYAEGEDG